MFSKAILCCIYPRLCILCNVFWLSKSLQVHCNTFWLFSQQLQHPRALLWCGAGGVSRTGVGYAPSTAPRPLDKSVGQEVAGRVALSLPRCNTSGHHLQRLQTPSHHSATPTNLTIKSSIPELKGTTMLVRDCHDWSIVHFIPSPIVDAKAYYMLACFVMLMGAWPSPPWSSPELHSNT